MVRLSDLSCPSLSTKLGFGVEKGEKAASFSPRLPAMGASTPEAADCSTGRRLTIDSDMEIRLLLTVSKPV